MSEPRTGSPDSARLLIPLALFLLASAWSASAGQAPAPALVLPKSEHGATHHVSPKGDDRNAGTENAPWASIAKAAAAIQPGDEVVVHGLLDPRPPHHVRQQPHPRHQSLLRRPGRGEQGRRQRVPQPPEGEDAARVRYARHQPRRQAPRPRRGFGRARRCRRADRPALCPPGGGDPEEHGGRDALRGLQREGGAERPPLPGRRRSRAPLHGQDAPHRPRHPALEAGGPLQSF